LTVVVSGPAPGGRARVAKVRTSRREGDGGDGSTEVKVRKEIVEQGTPSGSVLTLRVRKSELEQLAKETLKWDDFVKRVGVQIRLERDDTGGEGKP
jgi:hypothetical protein